MIDNQIRATLAAPPGQAAADVERRATYVASLLMFEDLRSAAREVDYLSRPLPLFYALSQAGRAIVAAHGTPVSIRGHGLTQDVIGGPITRTTVKAPTGHGGLFGAVATVLGCAGLTGPVELGALWAALPDLADTPHRDDRWPPALFLWPDDDGGKMRRFAGIRCAIVVPDVVAASAHADLQAYLGHYPHATYLKALRVPGLPGPALSPTPRGLGVCGGFAEVDADGRLERYHYLHQEVPEHRYEGEYWLIPRVGDNGDELPPLLLWWALLFGLSILARYEPAVWRAALDPQTPLAVPLEDLMDEALEALPHWLLCALYGHPIRTARPLR